MKISEGRAFRRAQIKRVKKARKVYFTYSWNPSPTRLGKLVHTAKACSCYMCGNPRRYHDGITVQEIKHDAREAYELLEVS